MVDNLLLHGPNRSNLAAREPIRHTSVPSAVRVGVIVGFGTKEHPLVIRGGLALHQRASA